jgi:seryl-tRNA synthetase
MISLNQIVENPDIFKQELSKRFKPPVIIDDITEKAGVFKESQKELEELRQQKNSFNLIIASLSPEEKTVKLEEMKIVSEKIKTLEDTQRELKSELDNLLAVIPNLTWDGIPVAKDDAGNIEIGQFGVKPEFDFNPSPYHELPIFKRDYLSEKGVEAVGFRGYYIAGELAKFQRALFNWSLDRILEEGFEYVIPPIAVNYDVMAGTGFFPTGQDDVYEVIEGDRTKYLVGSSEPSLMFMESNRNLQLADPRLLTAWTTCFRKEIGAHGKDTKGGIRVHQFEKVEMVAICKPDQSAQVFERLTNFFCAGLDLLGLHYHQLEVSSGDISIKNNRQIDIEAWFPATEDFRELCSSSNCTDYQTRNLNITFTNYEGQKELTHSLNCTGITNRAMFAIMEQFQQIDGRIKVPEVLKKYYSKEYLE